jgi:hypothetical protein
MNAPPATLTVALILLLRQFGLVLEVIGNYADVPQKFPLLALRCIFQLNAPIWLILVYLVQGI